MSLLVGLRPCTVNFKHGGSFSPCVGKTGGLLVCKALVKSFTLLWRTFWAYFNDYSPCLPAKG